MPVITRDDGIQFAVYTYRELLTPKKSSVLRQEIEFLREENGEFCRFFTQANGDLEVVFSRDEGYLLAETVWEHFDKPFDLIYCEALPDNETAILVVVRAGSIYLDSEVSLDTLVDEFASLTTGTNQYDIYIQGGVPLSQFEEEGKFTFENSFVKSFQELDEPLFERLPINPDYKLLEVNVAVDELQLGQEKLPIYVVIGVLALAIGLGYWLLKPEKPKEITPVVVAPPPPSDPYLDYKAALTTPSPTVTLIEIAHDVRELFTLPGWVPVSISFNDVEIKANLTSIGGGTDILLAWVRTNDVDLNAVQGSAILNLPIDSPDRKPPTSIYDIRDVVAIVYDRVKSTQPAGAVSLVETVEENNYIITSMAIELNQITTDILMLVGEELAGLPIVLDSGQFEVQDGLLSGNIRIQIVGART